MQNQYEYQFPEKNAFRGKEVTEPEFYIQERKEWFEKLWVDFSAVRSTDQFDGMKFDLGMEENRVQHIPNEYVKHIFSGHRGCGKSTELKRFSDEIDHPKGFLVIFVDLERETNIEQLATEDLYIVLISMLIRTLLERNIPFDKHDFEGMVKDWMSETELEKNIKQELGVSAEAKATVGWSFWKFFSAEGNLK